MNDDNLEHWIDKAQMREAMPKPASGVRVIKNPPVKSKGQIIMELAELLLPSFQKIFNGKRDNDGMLLQPAHIRGIALNYAELYVKARDENKAA